MKFKVFFPGGYRVDDVTNDNIDINVILPDNTVYFGTLFTINNVRQLMQKEVQKYFWATDMIIVEDLKERTIYELLENMLDEDLLTTAFCKIGQVADIYTKYNTFDDIPFWYPQVIQ